MLQRGKVAHEGVMSSPHLGEVSAPHEKEPPRAELVRRLPRVMERESERARRQQR